MFRMKTWIKCEFLQLSVPLSIVFTRGSSKLIHSLTLWIGYGLNLEARGANSLFPHGLNTHLLLPMAGGPSWQGCAQMIRKGISQPLPRTTYGLSWYLPSALLPGKQNKLTCLHEHGRMHWRQRFCSNFSKCHVLLYRRKWKTEFIPELDYSYCVLKPHTSHLKAPV